ncbi:MAG: hypothetical protein ACK5QX_04260, partial [bacterium]
VLSSQSGLTVPAYAGGSARTLGRITDTYEHTLSPRAPPFLSVVVRSNSSSMTWLLQDPFARACSSNPELVASNTSTNSRRRDSSTFPIFLPSNY